MFAVWCSSSSVRPHHACTRLCDAGLSRKVSYMSHIHNISGYGFHSLTCPRRIDTRCVVYLRACGAARLISITLALALATCYACSRDTASLRRIILLLQRMLPPTPLLRLHGSRLKCCRCRQFNADLGILRARVRHDAALDMCSYLSQV